MTKTNYYCNFAIQANCMNNVRFNIYKAHSNIFPVQVFLTRKQLGVVPKQEFVDTLFTGGDLDEKDRYCKTLTTKSICPIPEY